MEKTPIIARLLWFLAIWSASVVSLSLIATAIKLALH